MSTSLRSKTRRKSLTVSGFFPRLFWQISTPFAIIESSTSQMTAQSTSGLRKKHSRSPRPIPPEPISPSLIFSLGGGSPARAERKKGKLRPPAANGASPAVNTDLPRNFRRVNVFISEPGAGSNLSTWSANANSDHQPQVESTQTLQPFQSFALEGTGGCG